MSVIEEDLLAPRITKKSAIKVLVVASLLITLFVFSTFIYALILGTQRRDPSERLEDADREDASLVFIPVPWDIEDLIDELDINITEVAEELGLTEEELEELLGDVIEEMYDGNIDELDLADYAVAIAALLYSEQEVFRVYDYDNPVLDREDILWRYECFDEFTGDGWQSTALKEINDYYDYDDYYDDPYFQTLDLIRIKRPLSPNIGTNSLVLASLFPEPYIIAESINAPNLEDDETLLYKDDLGCTTADLRFTSDNSVNLTCDLFGDNLPTNDEINNTAVNAQYTPSAIKSRYIQLPPTVSTYLANNNDFKFHYDILDMIIDQDNDNAFIVANIIRNYLQSNFDIGYDKLINEPPEEGEDQVEWFCEKGEGLWSEFASAFCAFTRAFGVASRFVDGFNSINITEDTDYEEGKNYYAIKYRNLYNWAEIYVPTGPGVGKWVQMDIIFDSFGPGGNPLTYYNLTVESDFPTYNRGSQAIINATLGSAVASISGKEVLFFDRTDPSINLPSATTDQNGKATISITIDSTQVVGPHTIEAKYGVISNTTQYVVLGDIEVNLHSLNPNTVNVSEPIHSTNIVGNLTDPVNGKGVSDAVVTFHLFSKGTDIEIPGAFIPPGVITDDSGEFDIDVNVDVNVPFGEYYVRVDFNGTWASYPIVINSINDSSNFKDLNVTKEITNSLWFYIDNFESDDYNNPVIPRFSTIELKAVVLDESGTPSQGNLVYFYDYTNNSIEIGNNYTDANGITTINYYAGLNALAGPNLLFAKLGNLENYSYFILDDQIDVNLDLCPEPRVINSTTPFGRNFVIHGYLNDSTNQKPIKYGEISVHLFDGPIDVSYYLILESGSTQLDESGEIFLTYSVSSSIPAKNYTLQVWFNGTFLYSFPNNINNEHDFFLNWIAGFSDAANGFYELKVIDPTNVKIFLLIEGHPTTSFYNDGYLPERYNRGDKAHFQITVYDGGGSPAISGTLILRDVYTNQPLASYTFDGSEFIPGSIQLNVSTQLLHAGLHQIEVKYDIYDTVNTTYIIINETLTIDSNINPYPLKAIRNVDGFIVFGNLYDSGNFSRGLRVNIRLLNETNHDVSNYLVFEPGYQQGMTIWYDGTGYYEFRIDFIDPNCPYGRYYIRIDFNGTIDAPGIFLSDYMVHFSGILLNLNISARTSIINAYYNTNIVKDSWYEGDDLYIYGNLLWDNLSGIENVKVNITILLNGQILDSKLDPDFTDNSGFFNVTFTVGAGWDGAEVWIYFFPEDNFSYPEFYYIEPYQIQVFRQP